MNIFVIYKSRTCFFSNTFRIQYTWSMLHLHIHFMEEIPSSSFLYIIDQTILSIFKIYVTNISYFNAVLNAFRFKGHLIDQLITQDKLIYSTGVSGLQRS